MTNTELKDKIVELWHEYSAEKPKNERIVLYVCTAQDDSDKHTTTFAAVADRDFMKLMMADFMFVLAKQDPTVVKEFLNDLAGKMVEEVMAE